MFLTSNVWFFKHEHIKIVRVLLCIIILGTLHLLMPTT